MEYLDHKGLVAQWREALGLQGLLHGLTKGYQHHPHGKRWTPRTLMYFLLEIQLEGTKRGYSFDIDKVMYAPVDSKEIIRVTAGQVKYERELLLKKYSERKHLTKYDLVCYNKLRMAQDPGVSWVFHKVPGDVEPWERLKEV